MAVDVTSTVFVSEVILVRRFRFFVNIAFVEKDFTIAVEGPGCLEAYLLNCNFAVSFLCLFCQEHVFSCWWVKGNFWAFGFQLKDFVVVDVVDKDQFISNIIYRVCYK